MSANYVSELLDRFAGFGHSEALVSIDGRRFDYRQLSDRIRNSAAWLWEHGMRPGQTLGLLISQTAEAIFVQLGAHLIGCRTACMARTSPLPLLRSVLTVIDADAFLYEMAIAADLGPELATTARRPIPVFCIGQGGQGPDVTDPPEVAALPFDVDEIDVEPFALFQTSGTTGTAKLVRHGQRFFREIQKVSDYYRPDDGRLVRHLSVSGVWHAAGWASALMSWAEGGTIVMRFVPTPAVFLDTIATERVTSTMISPTTLYGLLDDESIDGADLSSLYSITIAASPATPARLIQARKYFGPALNVVYGMTELPGITAMTDVGADPALVHRLSSCGTPWEGAQVEVRDPEGKALPAGEIGEIWATSPQMTEGYFGQEELTATAVVNSWLCTGDIGRFDADGYLYILDRIADLINRGGDKIFSRQVEDALAEHPGVAQAAVIGVPDDRFGEAVHAYVVRGNDAAFTEGELRTAMVVRLNETWAPREIEFIDSLPLTEFGKVDKKALRARYRAGAAA